MKFGYTTPQQIFNKVKESSLTEYLLKLAQIFHSIGAKKFVAWLITAIEYKISVLKKWQTNKMAGRMSIFFKRNSSLSIRISEPTSLSSAMLFNKSIV